MVLFFPSRIFLSFFLNTFYFILFFSNNIFPISLCSFQKIQFVPNYSILPNNNSILSSSFTGGKKRMSKTNGEWDFGSAVSSTVFHFPEVIEKMVFPSSYEYGGGHEANNKIIPADILDTPKDYIFYLDVPALSKSDIQVTVEDEKTLVIRSGGKRKREEGEEEGCKYLRLERKAPHKMLRKFRLPDNANTCAISAKCENGVLTVIVQKLPPPPKSKTVEVTIA